MMSDLTKGVIAIPSSTAAFRALYPQPFLADAVTEQRAVFQHTIVVNVWVFIGLPPFFLCHQKAVP